MICLAYAIGAPIAGLLSSVMSVKLLIFLSTITLGISLMLVGPTQFLNSKALWIVFLGLALQGFGCAGIWIPVLPEIVKVIQED